MHLVKYVARKIRWTEINWDGLLDAVLFASIIPFGGALWIAAGCVESLLH